MGKKICSIIMMIAIALLTSMAVYGYENLSLGKEILIDGYEPTEYGYSSLDGTFTITIDGCHYLEEESKYVDSGVGVLGVLCSINNIDCYETYFDSNCIGSYDISGYLKVRDGDGYDCEFYNLEAPSDGKYAIGPEIKMGSKARVCMTYYIDPEVKDYTIILKDQYIMNLSLDENGEGVFLEEMEEVEEESSELTEETVGEQESNPVVLYNQDGYKVEVSDFDIRKNSFQLKFTNLTHYDVRASIVDGYVNEVMNGMDYSESVSSGKSGIGKATISKSDLVNAGIDNVEDVSFSLKISKVGDNSGELATIGSLHFSMIDGAIDASIVYTDSETIREVQELLNKLGYDCGAADGIAGKNTNSKILQFQSEHGLKENTNITDELLNALREIAG